MLFSFFFNYFYIFFHTSFGVKHFCLPNDFVHARTFPDTIQIGQIHTTDKNMCVSFVGGGGGGGRQYSSLNELRAYMYMEDSVHQKSTHNT